MTTRLILASQSAARQTLLRGAGIAFDVVPSLIDERAVQAAAGLGAPDEIAAHLARAKAVDVSMRHRGCIVIGADQTLASSSRLFNKPDGRDAATAQLRTLSGATHELHSAICAVRDGVVLFAHAESARMTMRPLSDAEIAAYLDAAGDAVTRSVGAYQIEGVGVRLFDKIEGDHFTILGLPLLPLLAFLRREGWFAF